MIVILGWDALDYEVAGEFNLRNSFGAHNAELKTFVNPVLKKPHTYEVWPSIITGQMPDGHGIHAEEYTHGTSWSSTWLNIAAVVSKYTVPERLRWYVGRKIRSRGHTFETTSGSYYSENSIPTLFDDKESVTIAIPNYRSELDEQLNIVSDRGAQLSQFLNIETNNRGETIHKPKVSLPILEKRLASEAGRKIAIVRSSLNHNPDIVFVWFGYLDTVGHLAPIITDERWQRDAYEQAAEMTALIRNQLADEDILICLSDHGLQDGTHGPSAFIGSNKKEIVANIDSVLDVYEVIEQEADTDEEVSETKDQLDEDSAKDVRNRLEELGYIN